MEESFRRQIAIGSAVGFSFLWIAAGYFTWILNGCKAYMPFISDFHLYSPGDFLFTTGTFVSGFLVFWVIMEVHSMNMKRISSGQHHSFWHGVTSCGFSGLIGAFSCIRRSAPWDTDGPMHGHYASIFSPWRLLVFADSAVTVGFGGTMTVFAPYSDCVCFQQLPFCGLVSDDFTNQRYGSSFDWEAYNASQRI